MKEKVSPREQALKDMRDSGLSFNFLFERAVRKSSSQEPEIPSYNHRQLKYS